MGTVIRGSFSLPLTKMKVMPVSLFSLCVFVCLYFTRQKKRIASGFQHFSVETLTWQDCTQRKSLSHSFSPIWTLWPLELLQIASSTWPCRPLSTGMSQRTSANIARVMGEFPTQHHQINRDLIHITSLHLHVFLHTWPSYTATYHMDPYGC